MYFYNYWIVKILFATSVLVGALTQEWVHSSTMIIVYMLLQLLLSFLSHQIPVINTRLLLPVQEGHIRWGQLGKLVICICINLDLCIDHPHQVTVMFIYSLYIFGVVLFSHIWKRYNRCSGKQQNNIGTYEWNGNYDDI